MYLVVWAFKYAYSILGLNRVTSCYCPCKYAKLVNKKDYFDVVSTLI
jgi:hypothetical protein